MEDCMLAAQITFIVPTQAKTNFSGQCNSGLGLSILINIFYLFIFYLKFIFIKHILIIFPLPNSSQILPTSNPI